MPDWEVIKSVWPLLAAVAGLWARLEVALAQNRDQSVRNEAEIRKLEAQLEAQKSTTHQLALGQARMEETLVSIGRTLERIDRKISGV
ncbi:MAG TPA: hypothetical protein PKE59_00280 [Novosphingobium sp.]|jgi:hypothetical protein|nr:hypothetical protein [Novosphingobium sp.]